MMSVQSFNSHDSVEKHNNTKEKEIPLLDTRGSLSIDQDKYSTKMVYISIYIQDISTCIKGDFHKKNKNDNELMKTTLLK